MATEKKAKSTKTKAAAPKEEEAIVAVSTEAGASKEDQVTDAVAPMVVHHKHEMTEQEKHDHAREAMLKAGH